jgi:lysine 6-dehydrogenase
MKVVVLGVGSVGRTIVRDLLENWNNIDEVIAVDYNFEVLKSFADTLKDSRITPIKGDVRNIDLTADILKKGDYFINSTWYEFNLHVLEAAIQAKRDGLDLGGLYWMTKNELELDEEVKKAGLTFLVGAGDDPGTSNVLARYGADKLDSVEEIHIRWGSVVLNKIDEPYFGFSAVSVMDETTHNAILYKDGMYYEVPPLSEKELTYFPEPIGFQHTYAIIHSELATLPLTIKGVRTVTYKDSWDESILPITNFLKFSGLVNREPIDVLGQKISPLHVLGTLIKPREPMDCFGALKVSVSGIENEKQVRYTFYLGPVGYKHEWDAGPTSLTTAYGATAALKMLSEGYISRRGVVPPELVNRPELWLYELRKRNIQLKVVKEETTTL